MVYQSIPPFVSYIEGPPIYYKNLPLLVDSPVQKGGNLHIYTQRCTNGNEALDFSFARVVHNVEGGKDYTLPDGAGVAIPGCIDTDSELVLPTNMVPARYQLIGVIRVKGHLAEHKIVFQSGMFDVIP